MITLFLPEKYIEKLDTLVASNIYPNHSEALHHVTTYTSTDEDPFDEIVREQQHA